MRLPFDLAIQYLRLDPKYEDACIFLGLEISGRRMKWREKSEEKYVKHKTLLLEKKKKKVEGHNQTINTSYSKAQNWMNRQRDYYFPIFLSYFRWRHISFLYIKYEKYILFSIKKKAFPCALILTWAFPKF